MNAPQNTGARYLKRVERSFPSDYPAKQGKAMIRRKNLASIKKTNPIAKMLPELRHLEKTTI